VLLLETTNQITDQGRGIDLGKSIAAFQPGLKVAPDLEESLNNVGLKAVNGVIKSVAEVKLEMSRGVEKSHRIMS
jgi:hypothetical protein